MAEKKVVQRSYSIANIPNTINGVALGNAGVSLLIKLLGELFQVSHHTLYISLCFFSLSSLFMLLYVLKLCLHYSTTISTDFPFSNPLILARSGVYCMSWSLVGSMLSSDAIGLPIIFPQSFILIGGCIQILAMSCFVVTCYRTKTLPEPFFNAAILSFVFPAITLPGNGEVVIQIRFMCLAIGILLFLGIVPVEVWRTVVVTWKRGSPIVAKDSSVAMLQSGAATICSAW